MRKIIMIHIFFLVISILVYVEGITKSGPDLIWNMMLALTKKGTFLYKTCITLPYGFVRNQYTLYTPTHRYVIFIFRCHNSLHLIHYFIYNNPGIKKV